MKIKEKNKKSNKTDIELLHEFLIKEKIDNETFYYFTYNNDEGFILVVQTQVQMHLLNRYDLFLLFNELSLIHII